MVIQMEELIYYQSIIKKTPMLVTGYSGQSLDWIAEHSDGWLYYPRDFKTLQLVMQQYKASLTKAEKDWKPFMQSLYVDVTKDSKSKPEPIHLTSKGRIDYFTTIYQNQTFTRKDYLNIFKNISSATASRDLKYAVENNLIFRDGDKRTTIYNLK